MDAFFSGKFKAIKQFEPIEATGGSISDITSFGVQYRVHRFISVGSSTFSVSNLGTDSTVEVLIVGGGGGGGSDNGGAGGGGGVITETINLINTGPYQVIVGNGGRDSGTGNTYRNENGQNSSFFGRTAIGGGRGANGQSGSPATGNGGSGGGGQGEVRQANDGGGTGTSGQGFNGGNGGTRSAGANGDFGGGGGGGARQKGQNGGSTNGGNGGLG